MGKKVLIASLVLLNLVFISVIVYTQIKIRQVERARQEAQQAMVFKEVGVGEEESAVIPGVGRKFQVEEGYLGDYKDLINLGAFKISEGNPEQGLEKRGTLSGYILEGPRLSSDNQVVVRLGFPKEGKELIADVLLGRGDDEIGIYLPLNGIITASQEWTIMKVAEIVLLLQVGDQIIIELSLEGVPEAVVNAPDCDQTCKALASQINTYYPENLAFLEDLQKGEGKLRTIGPVIQMIGWGRKL
jgi:hypothetical protein